MQTANFCYFCEILSLMCCETFLKVVAAARVTQADPISTQKRPWLAYLLPWLGGIVKYL